MTPSEKDDLFYVCSLIEYTARKTKNHRGKIVECLGNEGIKKQLHDARVNHCLSFEQVSDELIETYSIPEGDFDTISGCRYSIPSFTAIGKLYMRMILECAVPGNEIEGLKKVFTSFISDEISRFATGLYYESPSYLNCSYQSGELLR